MLVVFIIFMHFGGEAGFLDVVRLAQGRPPEIADSLVDVDVHVGVELDVEAAAEGAD